MATPKFPKPENSDFERWGRVIRRFGLTCVPTAPSPENGNKRGIMIKRKPDDVKRIGWVYDFESWYCFSDGILFTQEPTWPMFFDRFPPSRAEFIERKIHLWIKSYKEAE